MKNFIYVLICSSAFLFSNNSYSGPPGSSLTLTVDDTTYTAVTYNAQAWKKFASGVYQITISGAFNVIGPHRPVRSISFVVWDNSDATTHLGTFQAISGATQSPPHYVSAVYNRSYSDSWSTHKGIGQTETAIGSGSMIITQFDKTSKKISGTYNFGVIKGSSSKTVKGTFTNLILTRAD